MEALTEKAEALGRQRSVLALIRVQGNLELHRSTLL
jgi:hypothetical protein